MQYTIQLQAGESKRQSFVGSTLLLLSTGAASAIDLQLEIDSFVVEELKGVSKGTKVRGPQFHGASFTSPVDTELQVVVSQADISVSNVDGAEIKAQVTAWPAQTLHVSNDRGSPSTPLHVVSSATAPASTLTNAAPVAVGGAAVAISAADAGRVSLRITNLGPDPVAVGGAGLTWAMRCIVLDEGGSWVEDAAAGLAWYAITGAGNAASVTTQQVIA